MADRFYIKVNDQRPDLKVRLLEEDVPVDLTNAVTARLLMSSRRTGLKIQAAMAVLDQSDPDSVGVVSYSWASGDTDTAGEYQAEIQVTWPSGKPQTFPADGYINVTVMRDLGT